MEKPTTPSSSSSRAVTSPNLTPSSLPHPATDISSNINQQQSRKPPTPEELVAHYQSQGLDFKEASLKAIQDLQAFLHDLVARRAKKQIFMASTVRKLDNINTRLAVLDMKLDSKPSYPETISIGVGIGAAVRGVGFVAPHVAGAIGQMWDASRRRS
ncbi:hypothetical protein MRB53_017773 [Persea americana]|uniref:Uncharacterized protein n=1 Tax=Persea americana TaxID=3435 RepID=A0ACC2M5Y4_PERAE|nr:hypothetical protein MRB53_017773 [Persea americana]